MSAPAPSTTRSALSPVIAAAMIELRKMFAPRRILVLLFLMFVPAAIALVTHFVGAAPARDDPASQAWIELFITNAFLRSVAPLICLYIGASLWSEEQESGTLVYIVTRPVSRPLVLLAKYAAGWLFLTLVLGVGMAVLGGTLGVLREHGFGGVFATLTVLPMTTAVWLALFLAVSTMMRRALIGGLAVGCTLELVVAGLPTVARYLTPGHHIGSAVAAFGAFDGVPTAELVTGAPTGGFTAWLVLILITTVALTLACLRVRYAEYAPTRTD